jgi:hypothetical protein
LIYDDRQPESGAGGHAERACFESFFTLGLFETDELPIQSLPVGNDPPVVRL